MEAWMLILALGCIGLAGLLLGERMLEISHDTDFSPRRMYELDRDHGWGREITRLQPDKGRGK